MNGQNVQCEVLTESGRVYIVRYLQRLHRVYSVRYTEMVDGVYNVSY